MSKKLELVGQVFRTMVVIEYAGTKKQKTTWLCECSLCGETKIISGSHLLKNECGCKCTLKHRGLSRTNPKIYSVWRDMKNRCYNPKGKHFKNYGGRGIKVCDEWLNNFETFYTWAKDKWAKGLQLDREENDGDYTPENCRFVSRKVNSRNKRTNVIIEIEGEKKCMTDWCNQFNINRSTFEDRIEHGWSIIDALKITPHRSNRFNDPNYEHLKENAMLHRKPVLQKKMNGDCVAKYQSLGEASSITGIPKISISNCCWGKCKQVKGYIWSFIQ